MASLERHWGLVLALVGGLAVLTRALRPARSRAQPRRSRLPPARQPLRPSGGREVDGVVHFERADGSEVWRTVRRMDAFDFLEEQGAVDGYVVTSLPDMIELNMRDSAAYRDWLAECAKQIFVRLKPRSIAIFYQSDAKVAGEWLDKSAIIQGAIASIGGRLLWHKIAVFASRVDLARNAGRPQYSHVLAFSKDVRNDEAWLVAAATPDVIIRGEMPWARAMGVGACEAACKLVRAAVAHEGDRSGAPRACVIDPFCGMGTILAVANEYGLDSVGVELNLKRSIAARQLVLLGATESRRRRGHEGEAD